MEIRFPERKKKTSFTAVVDAAQLTEQRPARRRRANVETHKRQAIYYDVSANSHLLVHDELVPYPIECNRGISA
jgi:hypothetical protein